MSKQILLAAFIMLYWLSVSAHNGLGTGKKEMKLLI